MLIYTNMTKKHKTKLKTLNYALMTQNRLNRLKTAQYYQIDTKLTLRRYLDEFKTNKTQNTQKN